MLSERAPSVEAVPAASTLVDLLRIAEARFGNAPALWVGTEPPVSYRTLANRAQRLAGGLAQVGIRPGERIAVWLPNCVDFVVSLFAAADLGAILVPINTRHTVEEAAFVLRQSRSAAVIIGTRLRRVDFLSMVHELCPGLAAAGGPLSTQLPDLRLLITTGTSPSARIQPLATLEAVGASHRIGARPADPVLIHYTSGTTAFPKGVVLTQGNVAMTGVALAAAMRLDREDRFFTALPFFHTAGTVHAIATCLAAGTPLITMPTFEAAESVKLMAQHGCTCEHAVDTVILRQLDHDPTGVVGSLRKVWTTGGPAFRRRLMDLGVASVGSLFGMTETSGNSTITRLDDPLEKRLETVGRPLPGVEIEIRDPETDKPVCTGTAGEIYVRGWNVMQGYFEHPEATAEVLRPDGWLRTGDRGRLDADGYLHWMGRLKDIIRVGGENVSPEEVERALESHPSVQQACALGLPDPYLGEVVVGFVRAAPNDVPVEAELIAHVRQRLAGFKVPRRVHVVDEFPLTVTNKVRRTVLRDLARRMTGQA